MYENKFYNRLQHESSPYLLQHARNPVNWYPWCDEALHKARAENKIIIVSIGYAACHWCHVMERESFEDELVAKVMNDNFVCIKVDREERPDIDQVYMNAVQLITGGGGWPLNCFALPDGSPVYGGTYFPKDSWLHVLNSLVQHWQSDKQKLLEHALQIKRGMLGSGIIFGKRQGTNLEQGVLEKLVGTWKDSFDLDYGGENHVPKFPMPNNYEFLLTYSYFVKDAVVSNFVELTLDKMSGGGIYDHIGGGFARYSVDKYWKVPHFEKMLYDNAQLVSLYSKAYKKYKKEKYKNVVQETVDFITREMLSPNGGFYSSFDADSDGEEGKFYVWDLDEIKNVLGDKANIFSEYYSVKQEGNWENSKNIFHIEKTSDLICKTRNIDKQEFSEIVTESKELLFEHRKNRVHPSLDDKILTSWNALMIVGLLDAYQVFRDKRYLLLAIENAMFLHDNNLQDDGRLFRNHKQGKSTINAFLDDYAFYAHALIRLFGITGNKHWLELSDKLIKYSLDHFFDVNSGMFFYTSNLDAPLAVRKMEIADNVIPSSNSMMAKNLFLLSIYLGNNDYKEITKQMLANVKEDMVKYNRYYSNWAELASSFAYPFFEVIIVGTNAKEMTNEIFEYDLSNCAIAFSEEDSDELLFKNRFVDGKTLIYVCRDNACKAPVETVSEALKLAK